MHACDLVFLLTSYMMCWTPCPWPRSEFQSLNNNNNNNHNLKPFRHRVTTQFIIIINFSLPFHMIYLHGNDNLESGNPKSSTSNVVVLSREIYI